MDWPVYDFCITFIWVWLHALSIGVAFRHFFFLNVLGLKIKQMTFSANNEINSNLFYFRTKNGRCNENVICLSSFALNVVNILKNV